MTSTSYTQTDFRIAEVSPCGSLLQGGVMRLPHTHPHTHGVGVGVRKSLPPPDSAKIEKAPLRKSKSQVHLPSQVKDLDRIAIPLTDIPLKWSDQEVGLLTNVLSWQPVGVTRWIMTRSCSYSTATGWPPASCLFQAAVDWELWRRRAYLPDMDNRTALAAEYFYHLATLEPSP